MNVEGAACWPACTDRKRAGSEDDCVIGSDVIGEGRAEGVWQLCRCGEVDPNARQGRVESLAACSNIEGEHGNHSATRPDLAKLRGVEHLLVPDAICTPFKCQLR